MANQPGMSDVQPKSLSTNNLLVAADAPVGATAVSSIRPDMGQPPMPGIENENTLWEGRVSFRNFLGRAIVAALGVLGWFIFAVIVANSGRSDFTVWVYLAALPVLLYICVTIYKFLRARRNHQYRLTTRRLFLTTGIFQRRVDQVELIRVKDLFMQQSVIGSWLDVGSVTILSSEESLPKAVLLGIEKPRDVMDLIWHRTRLERDARAHEVTRV
jgi:hypothetical protein